MKPTGGLKLTTPSDREVVLTRVFDAPRRLVFEAMTRPELLKRWLHGPHGWSMVVCENDPRAGGVYRWVWHGPDRAEMAMHGVYREVVPPERIVRTEAFDFGCESQAGEQLVTLVLAKQDGRTMLTLTLLYPSKESRDATLASGMERGISASYDRLAELLASTPAGAESHAGP
jgi:uncharacterized protein YndB with AHSA1/START domain